MPIFRSRHQADLLTWLLLHPDREYTTTELARRFDIPLTTLHREVQRLETATILRSRTVGRSRLLRANLDHPSAAALTRLLELTFGPHTVIEDEFAGISGVDHVLIFGSWAARYHGAEGPPPGDIDVLVVGTPSRTDVYEAADRAQERLGMQVNPVLRSPGQWTSAADSLVQQIRASPSVDVRKDAA